MLRLKHLIALFLTVSVIIGLAESINPSDSSQASTSKSSEFRSPDRNNGEKNRPPADPHRSIPAEDADIAENATTADFERLTLVQKWPSGICTDISCDFTWVLHGLWPSNANGKPLENCEGKGFDRELLTNKRFMEWLQKKLFYYWADLETGNSWDDGSFWNLWENAWTKHGTCYGQDQVAYFGKAVELIEKYNVGKMLSYKNIRPTLKWSYPYLKIHDAIRDSEVMNNHGAKIICESKVKNRQRHEYIKEVHICFKKNRNFFEVDDCPDMYEGHLESCNVGQTKYY